MKRQRHRSEVYRARRWDLKRKRRQRRDPDSSKGVFTQDDAKALYDAYCEGDAALANPAEGRAPLRQTTAEVRFPEAMAEWNK